MDNIGGFKNLSCIRTIDVETFSIKNDKVAISLVSLKEWNEIPFGKNGIEFTSKAENGDNGTLYTHEMVVKVPEYGLTESERIAMDNLALIGKRAVIVKYDTLIGTTFVVGSKKFPLHLVVEHSHPSSPASGYNGYSLTFSGKSLYPQMILSD